MTRVNGNDRPGDKMRSGPKAFWGSDIDHWDITDASFAFSDAYSHVEERLLGKDDFEEFMFTKFILFHAGLNPNSFTGTVLGDAAGKVLSQTVAAA